MAPTVGQANPMRNLGGAELKRLRESRGWSQAELARRAGFKNELTGVRTIGRWEKGDTKNPRVEQYYRAIELLAGVSQPTLTDLAGEITEVKRMVGDLGSMLHALIQNVRDAVDMLKAEQASYTRRDDGTFVWNARLAEGERLKLDDYDRRLLRKAVAMLEQAAD